MLNGPFWACKIYYLFTHLKSGNGSVSFLTSCTFLSYKMSSNINYQDQNVRKRPGFVCGNMQSKIRKNRVSFNFVKKRPWNFLKKSIFVPRFQTRIDPAKLCVWSRKGLVIGFRELLKAWLANFRFNLAPCHAIGNLCCSQLAAACQSQVF